MTDQSVDQNYFDGNTLRQTSFWWRQAYDPYRFYNHPFVFNENQLTTVLVSLPEATGSFKKEDGDFLLLETGDNLLHEG